MRDMKSNRFLAVIIFFISVLVLYPNIRTLPQHGDEKLYVWKAGYYIDRLLRLDFSSEGDSYLDPVFNPMSFWALEQPFGSHWIYSLAMGISNTHTPELPYLYGFPALQGSETDIPADTLFATRLAGLLCAAIGLALLTLRFGWGGFVSVLILLTISSTRDSFSRAWAEGPLMLGIGLCSISYKTRWFPVALGVAAAFKLTAIVLWPLIFISGSCGKEFPWRRSLSLLVPPLVVSLLTPVSWFFTGPFYLVFIIRQRILTWLEQSHSSPNIGGVFFPDRYAWPFELLVLLLMSYFLTILIDRQKIHHPSGE
jgi:hypothetical protein